jgi:hypothetical protein
LKELKNPLLLFLKAPTALLIFFLTMSSVGLFAQTEPPAQPPADKTKFMGKISHWLAAYGISGEDFMREKRNGFKAQAYAEVYIEAVIDHDAWMFTMLNRVTKAKYAEKQTPFILFGLKFKPKDDNLNSYEISLSLEEGSAVSPQQGNSIVTGASAKYLGGKTYAEPAEAAEDIEKAITEALAGIQAKVGTSLAPNLMVRYQNEVFWNGHEIPILETEGNTVELEAIDKNGVLLNPNDIRWTNADPFQSKGIVDMTGIPGKSVTLTKGTEAMTVTLTRVSASQDIRDLLKILIVEILSTKKQQAADSVALLKQDSIRNAQDIVAQLALIEASNFRMTSGGTQLALFADGPRLMTQRDEATFEEGGENIPRKAGFRLLHKRRELRQTIRKKVNVVAFANLVVDQPDRLTALLEELLRNSGRLVAQLALNRNQEGLRDAAKNIVVDFLNKNIERIAGGSFGFAQPVEPPLQVTLPPPTASIPLRENQYLYFNTQLAFAGKDSLVTELTAYLNNLPEKLYVFINYSQDVSTESFLSRSPNARPQGLPEGKNFVVLTVVNIPGSVTYQVMNSNGCESAGRLTRVKSDLLNCIQSAQGIEASTLVSEEFQFDGFIPEPQATNCLVFLSPSYKPIILPKGAIEKLYVAPSLPLGILSGFLLKIQSTSVYYKSKFLPTGDFLGYFINGDLDKPFIQKEHCGQVDLSGPKTVEILIIDQANCVILHKTGTYAFPANSTDQTSIDYSQISQLSIAGSTRLITGSCGLEQRALVSEEWKPTGLDLTIVDSEQFRTLADQKAQQFANQLDAAIKAYPTAPEKFYKDEFFHIVNASLLPAATKELDFKVLEHKLQFLKKETNIDFFIILDEVDFYFNPDSEKRNDFAKKVFELTPSLKGRTNAVLVTIPYCKLERFLARDKNQYVMPGIYYDKSLVNSNFIRASTYPNILTMLTSAYKWTPKPHRQYVAFLHADGTITFSGEKNNGAKVVGQSCINCVGFFKNSGYDQIKNLPRPIPYRDRAQGLVESLPSYPIEMFKYSSAVLQILEQSKLKPVWNPVRDKIFKEANVAAYYKEYAYKMAFASSGLVEWWNELQINFREGDGPGSTFVDLDKACYTFSALVVIDPIVYTVIDIAGVIPVVDNFADVAGLSYATARLDYENMTNYAIGLAAVGVGTVVIKYGGRVIKAAYKGGVWMIEEGSKTARRLTKFQSLKAPLCRMVGITDELRITDGLITKIDEIVASGNFSVTYLDEVSALTTDAAKIARLEKIAELEGLIKNLPATSVSTLREDLTNAALTKSFIDNPRLVEGWKVLQNSVRRTDIKTLKFFDDPSVIASYQDVISRKIQEVFQHIPIEELTAVRHYSSEAYAGLNEALRKGVLTDGYRTFEELLNAGMSKLSKFDGEKVYRGCGIDESILAHKWIKGQDVVFPDFKSTSTSMGKASKFLKGDVYYEILNPKGINICQISCHPSELEVLFQSKAKFKVREIKADAVIYDDAFEPIEAKKITLEFIGYE